MYMFIFAHFLINDGTPGHDRGSHANITSKAHANSYAHLAKQVGQPCPKFLISGYIDERVNESIQKEHDHSKFMEHRYREGSA